MAEQKRYTFSEIAEIMWKFNSERGYTTKGNPEHLTAVAVITADSFNKPYDEKSRSYVFTSDNKAFLPNQMGSSIFACCLDGTDSGIRLDWYLKEVEEYRWHVEYCYITEDE